MAWGEITAPDLDFLLVLSGSCRLIIEGQERTLRAWDFVHCPPGTAHVFIGAGTSPCAILMMGTRDEEEEIEYPVEPLALAAGAGVATATCDPRESHAGIPPSVPVRGRWPR